MKKLVPNDAILIPEAAQRVFEGQIFDVYQWPQKLFDGSDATFEILRRADTALAICLVDEHILVLDDEQPHTGSRVSFPGGRVDPSDTSTLAAAQREIREETGYEFQNWHLVNVSQPHTKIEWFVYLYIAWDGHQVAEPHLDAGEKITVQHLTFDELKAALPNKAGYLGNNRDIFRYLNSVEELLTLPGFHGQEIDR